ncbi:DUF6252 family protein [uncultured Algibacter sp.]|uniref:DUF6252 family protein n=1 Tax=uncultured Algibacter sp. TaxID=298659 RepID=UPI002607E0E4|nr:DUF6252 family protein [uncultured Algibacter sp.]
MRNLKQIMLLVMIGSLLTFTSCSSSDDGGSDGNAASGTLTANIGGVSFQSMEISSKATLASAGGINNLIIIASNSDGNAFAITISGYAGEGTYDITGASLGNVVATYTETDVNLSNPTASTTEIWQAPYDNTKVGSVSISEETNSNVKGTFSFMCKNVNGDNSIKDVTSGSFNLSKQTI